MEREDILAQQKETFETWDKIAKVYEDKYMTMDLYDRSYDAFIDKYSGKDYYDMLDLGCGPGNVTKYLLSKRQDFKVFGIDVSPSMIKLARNNNPNAVFGVMDVRQVHMLDRLYDGVLCGFCLPYLDKAQSRKLIFDVYNLLQLDGVFYFSFVSGKPQKSGFKTGADGRRVYFYYHEKDTVIQVMKEIGFTLEEIFEIEFPSNSNKSETETHTIILARK